MRAAFIDYCRRAGDQAQGGTFTLEALLHDIHMEQSEKSDAETRRSERPDTSGS